MPHIASQPASQTASQPASQTDRQHSTTDNIINMVYIKLVREIRYNLYGHDEVVELHGQQQRAHQPHEGLPPPPRAVAEADVRRHARRHRQRDRREGDLANV
jgi:hypothetical protein